MKKKFIIHLLGLCMLSSFGQQASSDFANSVNHIFQPLNKNRVPHGILTDFGLDNVDLTAYGGQLSSNNHTSRTTVHEAFYTLISSRVRQVNTGFMLPVDFEKRWHNKRKEGVITLGGLYFKYAKFKSNAVSSRKIRVQNNQIYDVYRRGVWQNPYDTKSMFILAPAINTYKGLNFKVQLPQDIFLSNSPSDIQSIAVDLQDGLGYRSIDNNQTLNVSYAQPNTYIWTYKLTLKNGQTLYSHSKVAIKEGLRTKSIRGLSASKGATTQSTNLNEFLKTTITATVPYYEKRGSATVYIRDAGGDSAITKPLIVAEGFDTGAILNPEQEAGDSNIEDFIESYQLNRSNSIELEDEMDTYDIIYVDWNNGVDFIQRNAYVLEEVIRWVNNNKEGNTPNTILGQSMGGLVARYALADIEKNRDFNHDTALYISHDSPHLGANTPIAMQHFNRHLKRLYQRMPIAYGVMEILIPLAYDAAGIFTDMLNQTFGSDLDVGQYVSPNQYLGISDFPASRQMLYNWVAPSYAVHNEIHNIWQEDYTDMGYPNGYNGQPIRHISIANGSECGVSQAIEGDILGIHKNAAKKTVLNAVIGFTDIGVAAALTLGGDFIDAIWLTALAIVPGSSSYEIRFNMRPMMQLNQNKQIYFGRIRYKKKILWFIPVNINFTNVSKNQPHGIYPYDNYGGGWINPNNVINQLPSVIRNLLGNIATNPFSFIPTASAVDAGGGVTPLTHDDYERSYVGGNPPPAPKNSPFDNFTTHFDQFNNDNNSAHISFNRRNGNWLAAELDGQNIEVTDCSFVCEGIEIKGEDVLCSSGQYSFQTPVPDDASVTWTVNNTSAVSLSNTTGLSTTLTTPPNSYRTNVELTATISSVRCQSTVSISKTIRVGKPGTPAYLNGPTTVNTGALVRYYAGPAEGATSYKWWLPYPFDVSSPINYFAQNWQMAPTNHRSLRAMTGYAGNSGYVQVMGVNECGCGGARILYVRHGNGGGGGGGILTVPAQDDDTINSSTEYFRIYPNPSSGTVNVDLKSSSNIPLNQGSIEGKLFDLYGNVKKTVSITNNRAVINTSGLTTGVYVLKIYVNNTVEAHQVIVK